MTSSFVSCPRVPCHPLLRAGALFAATLLPLFSPVVGSAQTAGTGGGTALTLTLAARF